MDCTCGTSIHVEPCPLARIFAALPDLRSTDEIMRADGGKFAKGKSPNPGGQSQWMKDVKRSLRDLTPLAAKTLKQVMEGSEKDADRVRAADVVLKYTVPPPKQTHRVEGKGGDPLAMLTPEALVAFITKK